MCPLCCSVFLSSSWISCPSFQLSDLLWPQQWWLPLQAWGGRATLWQVYGGVLGLWRLRLQALWLRRQLWPAHRRLHQQVNAHGSCSVRVSFRFFWRSGSDLENLACQQCSKDVFAQLFKESLSNYRIICSCKILEMVWFILQNKLFLTIGP